MISNDENLETCVIGLVREVHAECDASLEGHHALINGKFAAWFPVALEEVHQ